MPKHTFDKLSNFAKMGITLASTLLFGAICALICAFFAPLFDNPFIVASLLGEGSFLLSMLFCGFFGAKTASGQKYALGMLSGIIFAIFTLIGSLFFDGTEATRALVLLLLGLFLCASGAALGSRAPKRRRKR